MNSYRSNGFSSMPPVVKNLIIINVIFLALQFTLERMQIDLSQYLGLHYWRSDYFKPWQLLTHMFMHGNFMHLLSNMFALWMFGSVLENTWGSQRFLLFYMVTGIGAACMHLGVLSYEYAQLQHAFELYQQQPSVDQFTMFVKHQGIQMAPFQDFINAWMDNPNDSSFISASNHLVIQYQNLLYNQATVGASGAVFGLLFAFGYLFPNTLLYIYFLMPIKAKYFVALYALFELYSGVQSTAGDNIAHYAHLGGMLMAFIILTYWKKHDRTHFY